MTELVVEPLEVVEVDHRDRQAAAVASGAFESGAELGSPAASVRQAGELVHAGELTQPPGLRLDLTQQLGHPGDDEQEQHRRATAIATPSVTSPRVTWMSSTPGAISDALVSRTSRAGLSRGARGAHCSSASRIDGCRAATPNSANATMEHDIEEVAEELARA